MLETSFCFKKEASPVSRALMVAAGMCVFALFVHSKYPLKGISALGLGMTFLTLFTDLRTESHPAVLIGATEEVLYRGYIQGRVRRFGPFKAAVFAALCHSAYKGSLFVFHNQPVDINMFLLVACTFTVGLVLGVLRERAGSLLPAVAAHVVFDIVAYGAYAQAPWWVWS